MTYAWRVTKDHSDEDGPHPFNIVGPSDATDADVARLDDPSERHVFRLYDDDGNLMASGFGVHDGDEDGCIGPLADFGEGYYGCTYIRWQGHPEWDCG